MRKTGKQRHALADSVEPRADGQATFVVRSLALGAIALAVIADESYRL